MIRIFVTDFQSASFMKLSYILILISFSSRVFHLLSSTTENKRSELKYVFSIFFCKSLYCSQRWCHTVCVRTDTDTVSCYRTGFTVTLKQRQNDYLFKLTLASYFSDSSDCLFVLINQHFQCVSPRKCVYFNPVSKGVPIFKSIITWQEWKAYTGQSRDTLLTLKQSLSGRQIGPDFFNFVRTMIGRYFSDEKFGKSQNRNRH